VIITIIFALNAVTKVTLLQKRCKAYTSSHVCKTDPLCIMLLVIKGCPEQQHLQLGRRQN